MSLDQLGIMANSRKSGTAPHMLDSTFQKLAAAPTAMGLASRLALSLIK
ncbi:hypothetical protein AB4048_24035 [Rhizobium sp. RAF56]